ncbi:MAG: DUF4339 domain-containing protein [Rubellimicrobium sp.]|nr:DUF4339 domain-containing protein [Rubellimicrobium sp.]
MTSPNRRPATAGRMLAGAGIAALLALAPPLLAQEADTATDAADVVADVVTDAADAATDAVSPAPADAPEADTDTGAVVPPPPPPEPPPPPPPPPEPALEVYVAVSGQTTGPFDRAAIEAQIASGALTGDTYVWQEGMADWLHAADVPEVAALLDAGAAVTPGGFTVDDPAAYLDGHWTFSADDLEVEGGVRGAATGEMFFTADGRMALNETFTVTVPNPMVIEVSGRGTYSTEQVSPTSFVLRPQLQMVYTVDGVEQARETLTDPTTVDVIDEATIRDDEGTLMTRAE